MELASDGYTRNTLERISISTINIKIFFSTDNNYDEPNKKHNSIRNKRMNPNRELYERLLDDYLQSNSSNQFKRIYLYHIYNGIQ